MPVPLAIKASFLLSGMLGLQVQVPDGKGNFQTVNQTVPFSVSTSFEPNIHVGNSENTDKSELGRSAKFLTDLPSSLNQNHGNKLTDYDGMKTPVIEKQQCGSRYCDWSEICVSWKLDDTSVNSGSSNRQQYQECHKADGSDYSKMNPKNNSTANLCPYGKTHSIVSEPSECRSCGLTWKYRCVQRTKSPHSCLLKKCPASHLCFETVHCELNSPCYILAVCEHDSQVLLNHR